MATSLECLRPMTRGKLITATTILLVSIGRYGVSADGGQTPGQTPQTQGQTPTATFKAGVDLVRVAAVVRDRKGRFVQDLTMRDFEVLDGGAVRRIADFRS